MAHNFAKNARFTTLASGSFVNAVVGGTGAPAFAGDYEYHTAIFNGTIGNTGTLIVYGHTTSTGGGTAVLGSVVFGSGNASAVAFEIASPVLTGLGTDYQYVSAQLSIPAGGTLGGALSIISTMPSSAGGTGVAYNNLAALGTLYA